MKLGHPRIKVSAQECDYLMSSFAKRYYASYHRPGRRKATKRIFARRARRLWKQEDRHEQ